MNSKAAFFRNFVEHLANTYTVATDAGLSNPQYSRHEFVAPQRSVSNDPIQRSKFVIPIKPINEPQMMLELPISTTINDLLSMISVKSQLPNGQIRLLYKGKILTSSKINPDTTVLHAIGLDQSQESLDIVSSGPAISIMKNSLVASQDKTTDIASKINSIFDHAFAELTSIDGIGLGPSDKERLVKQWTESIVHKV